MAIKTPEGYIEGGKITGAHGIKGALKFQVYTESLAYYTPNVALLLREPNGREYEICALKAVPSGKSVLLTLKDVTDRNQAEALAGSLIFVPKDVLPEPEEGEFYWFELIGLDVVEADGRELGKLDHIFETGSNDVYVVKKGGNELLLPALPHVILDIDLEAKRIMVKIPEGLLP